MSWTSNLVEGWKDKLSLRPRADAIHRQMRSEFHQSPAYVRLLRSVYRDFMEDDGGLRFRDYPAIHYPHGMQLLAQMALQKENLSRGVPLDQFIEGLLPEVKGHLREVALALFSGEAETDSEAVPEARLWLQYHRLEVSLSTWAFKYASCGYGPEDFPRHEMVFE